MLEKLQKRDRVALMVCAIAVGVFLIIQFGVFPAMNLLPQAGGDIQARELTLRRDEHLVRESNQEQAQLALAQEHLKEMEAGLLESPSASLANAEWQRLVSQQASSQGIELNSSEFLRTQDLGKGYSLVLGRVQLRCRMDQFLQFLVGLANSPKLMSVARLRVWPIPGDPQKQVNVELIIGAPMRTARATGNSQGQKP